MTARLVPATLPEWVRRNPLRRAEIEVYDKLRKQLPSRYSVYYSRPWIGTNQDGTEKEGEADFVIASEATGFLVVEVKGGGVGRDGTTGKWYSIDREYRKHTIKNPIDQALRSKRALLEKLRAFDSMKGKWIGAGTCAVLPDSTGSEAFIDAETPRDHFALAEDMPRLGEWMMATLERTIGANGGALGSSGMRALDCLLANSFQLRVPLARSIQADHQLVIAATEQQYALLEFLKNHNRAGIAGAAGTGKTLLAVHKAVELADAVCPQRVLLTCFNAPLACWLKSAARRANLEVGTFHEICIALARRSGVALPQNTNPDEYFKTSLPAALLDAVEKNSDLAYTGIVVDEGQDFQSRWLEVLQLALRNDSSSFWVFYDDNQRLYRNCEGILAAMPAPPFALRRNVRNPQAVFERLMPFLGDSNVTCLGPAGQPVEEVFLSSGSSIKKSLTRLVQRLTVEEQIEPGDIAVLVSTKDEIETVCPSGRFGTVLCCDAESADRGRVCVDTVRRFKGLERKVIILVDPDGMAQIDELFYVALSRATGHLILVQRKALTSPHLQ